MWLIEITGDPTSVICSANGKKYTFGSSIPIGDKMCIDKRCALDLIRAGAAVRIIKVRKKRVLDRVAKTLSLPQGREQAD